VHKNKRNKERRQYVMGSGLSFSLKTQKAASLSFFIFVHFVFFEAEHMEGQVAE